MSRPSKSAQLEFMRAYRRYREATMRLSAAEARLLRAFGGNWELAAKLRDRLMAPVDRMLK